MHAAFKNSIKENNILPGTFLAYLKENAVVWNEWDLSNYDIHQYIIALNGELDNLLLKWIS